MVIAGRWSVVDLCFANPSCRFLRGNGSFFYWLKPALAQRANNEKKEEKEKKQVIAAQMLYRNVNF